MAGEAIRPHAGLGEQHARDPLLVSNFTMVFERVSDLRGARPFWSLWLACCQPEPEILAMTNAKIHPTAIICPNAKISANVEIGPFSIVGSEVTIGEKTIVQSHVVIESEVAIGRGNFIGHGAIIGVPPQDVSFSPERKTKVEIGDDNIIREYCTIHR